MWDNINLIVFFLIVKKRRPLSNIEKRDGKQCHQTVLISYVLNTYFRDIPSYLASKLPKSNCHFTSYLQGKKSFSALKQSARLKFF